MPDNIDNTTSGLNFEREPSEEEQNVMMNAFYTIQTHSAKVNDMKALPELATKVVSEYILRFSRSEPTGQFMYIVNKAGVDMNNDTVQSTFDKLDRYIEGVMDFLVSKELVKRRTVSGNITDPNTGAKIPINNIALYSLDNRIVTILRQEMERRTRNN